ncbi:MAG: methyltransferase domain-containing protein [Nevskia sp.]|nr:methyltransferase domain-containing protein [Nevskia sp.]
MRAISRIAGRKPGAAAAADDGPAAPRSRGAAPPRRPAVFTEKGYLNYLRGLLEAGMPDAAIRYYVESLPDIAASNTNLKEKFNHALFPARLLERGATAKYGYHKLLRKFQSIATHLAGSGPLPPGAFVELGCGAHDPLTLAACFYLNGHDPAFGIDIKPPRNELYSALSMYDVLANMHLFPERYCFPSTPVDEFRRRLGHFDIAAFERGDFREGFAPLAGAINFEAVDIVQSSIVGQSVALLVSFAVLEHVSDIDNVCRHLYRILKPGGVVFHFVDLADHRVYRGDKRFNAFSFLQEEQPPASLNRLRAHQITAAHESAGFAVVKDARDTLPMTEEEHAQLLPQFRQMRLEDVSAVKQRLILRKPRD